MGHVSCILILVLASLSHLIMAWVSVWKPLVLDARSIILVCNFVR